MYPYLHDPPCERMGVFLLWSLVKHDQNKEEYDPIHISGNKIIAISFYFIYP